MITVRGLTKRYGEKDILTNIDLKIGDGKKIGLVGRNGYGKSTLFKVITGVEEATSGHIEMQNELIGYIPQEFDFPNTLVGEYLEEKLENPWDFYKVEVLATELQFNNFDPNQKLNTLSEGQKMKVKLIEMLLNNPTTLFIDEPTNHLDIEGIMWFEKYVRSLSITIVMISHDRSFLNHTVDEIWEIDKCQLFRFVGDYDNYRTEKLKLIDKWDQEYVLFLKKKAHLEQLLENVRKISAGKARGKAIGAAKKRIEREVTNKRKEKYAVKKITGVDFDTDVRTSKLMLRFDNVTKKYGDKLVFKDLSFEIRGKEKVWLFGPNGSGKTTMVKIVTGEEEINEGTIKVGNDIKIGYFSQTQSHLNNGNELLDEFTKKSGMYYGAAYKYLERFLFNRDTIRKRVWQLSPGERARFAFAIFSTQDYDLMILDEPDNHLDIETKEVIEKSLREFTGTLFLISHDRYFVERIGMDKVLNLREGVLTYF